MEPQPYTFHTLPAVFMLETQLPENIVGDLNTYLDKLMIAEERKSHAGTLVGQIGHGQQLTMDHLCEEMSDFNVIIQGLAMDYVKQFCAASGNPLQGNREVMTDELWSVHSSWAITILYMIMVLKRLWESPAPHGQKSRNKS